MDELYLDTIQDKLECVFITQLVIYRSRIRVRCCDILVLRHHNYSPGRAVIFKEVESNIHLYFTGNNIVYCYT